MVGKTKLAAGRILIVFVFFNLLGCTSFPLILGGRHIATITNPVVGKTYSYHFRVRPSERFELNAKDIEQNNSIRMELQITNTGRHLLSVSWPGDNDEITRRPLENVRMMPLQTRKIFLGRPRMFDALFHIPPSGLDEDVIGILHIKFLEVPPDLKFEVYTVYEPTVL